MLQAGSTTDLSLTKSKYASRFDEEFKREVADLASKPGAKREHVARGLGVSPYRVARFFWNATAHGTHTRHVGPPDSVNACAFIRANIAGDLTVEHIAKTIGISGPHLHHLFRLHLPRTPHGFILEERFQKARNLMHGIRLQSKEITYRCGFRDTAEFSRTFRRLAGCLPREYRLPFMQMPLVQPSGDRKILPAAS